VSGRSAPSFRYEEAVWAQSALLVGVDEVGRGPLAGPVLAAAIVFPPGTRRVRGVRDSKVLTGPQRASLVPRIRAAARYLGLGAASVHEIDRLNIRLASALAMRRAIARVAARAARDGITELRVVLDGLPLPEVGYRHEAVIDGDARCYSVAAAAIVAKEVRDALMRRLAARYPGYGWENNAGYATAQHCEAIVDRGPSPHHRRSFSPVVQLPLWR
jgi:ribonuclease HII